MRRRAVLTALSSLFAVPAEAHARDSATKALSSCRQLLMVETANWNATSGVLTLWVRSKPGANWCQDGGSIPAVIGAAGLRWGRGLHAVPRGSLIKREGDRCAPAGVFSLDSAFGSMTAKESGVSRFPWQQMTSHHAGVDDFHSAHYNRIVDAARMKRDWSSAENMMPPNGVYRRGLIVRHNWDQKQGAGSCIFIHIWRGPRSTTAGCTAMAEKNLVRVLRWLDAASHPLLVQLPHAEWSAREVNWGLPLRPGGIFPRER